MRSFKVTDMTALKIWGNPITLTEFNKIARELFPERAKGLRTYSPNQLRAIRQAAGIGPMPKGRPLVFTFNSAKGGVGKTLFTANLGVILMLMGYRILVIDGDPQSSCTTLYGYEPDEQTTTLKRFMSDPSAVSALPQAVHTVYEDGSLDLLASGIELSALEEWMSEQDLKGVTKVYEFFHAAQDYLSNYDIILIDSNPWTPRLNKAYAYASDYILVPADLEGLSIRTLHEFFAKNAESSATKFLTKVRDTKVRLVANRDEKTRIERNKNLLILAEKYPDELVPVVIKQSAAFLKQAQVARAKSRPLAELDPAGAGVDDLQDLARFIETDMITEEAYDVAA